MRVNPEELSLKDKVVFINRVAKVVKGGKRFNFARSSLLVTDRGMSGSERGRLPKFRLLSQKPSNKPKNT